MVLPEPKTEKAKRPVPLPDFALKASKTHCDSQNRNQGFIFVTTNNTPYSPRNLIRHFKEVIEEIGLQAIRIHNLRHTSASLLLSAGVHPKVVQEMLGHSQINLTLDTYSHVLPGLQDEAADKMNKLITPA